ncbi:MAG: hypothetical protein ABIY55_11970 [Kofleriaceae bacterium]
MRSPRLGLLCVIALACRAADRPATPTCATRAAELKTLLAQLVEPTAKPTPPWPTGDPATDRRIADARTSLRAALAPRDPAQALPPLMPGVTPGALEHELASCPPALDQLARVGNVAPAERNRTFVAIADRLSACDCHVDLPFVGALFYLSARGPD